MKIALDPYMHRHLSLEELPSKVKELGYDWIELSPRGDFLEWFKAPRVFPDRIKSFKKGMAEDIDEAKKDDASKDAIDVTPAEGARKDA